MADDLKKVRYRNDGDDFHLLWAARRCLRILDFNNDLVAVAIEGISGREKTKSSRGLLVVDMAEYFGGEDVSQARQIVYCQLKHSTTSTESAWTAAQIQDVIKGFSERYAVLIQQYGADEIRAKVKFQFFTNRPVSSNVLKAIEAGMVGTESSLKGHVKNAFLTIQKSCDQLGKNLKDFLQTLDMKGGQKNRSSQEAALIVDISRVAANRDLNVQLRALSGNICRT